MVPLTWKEWALGLLGLLLIAFIVFTFVLGFVVPIPAYVAYAVLLVSLALWLVCRVDDRLDRHARHVRRDRPGQSPEA